MNSKVSVTPRDRLIRISPDEIFEFTKFFPLARPQDKPWRHLVEREFKKHHWVEVLDHTKLRFYMPDDPATHQFIEIVGKMGEAISEPKA